MTKLAIIGGSGLTQLDGLEIIDEINPDTQWGKPSAAIIVGKFNNNEILFLPRHGNPHTIPPHKINYRANIQALKDADVSEIIAVNAVGGITQEMTPCRIVIPDQLIDFTHGRIDTFYEDNLKEVVHIDFTSPYSESLRQQLINAANINNIDIYPTGTYAVTQGPRLETAAEIIKYEKDGCDIVGMTSMPEASLARELEMKYVCCSLVVNWAAGKTDEIITMDIIENNLKEGMGKVMTLLSALFHERQ
ncbi:MAG: S-methyl-5'-thioinosine phosphorylase [Proteobacteria bacterium]|nr:S-methyl-5'-thioinosine phosphorylase [Pseudomonadota bacterium]NOG61320.1 S-methyl-5'-thioinosine phosphorylase [Pseudomonadota bacterium]